MPEQQHRVAIAVFCTTDGVDEIDARLNAKAVIQRVLRAHAPDGLIRMPMRGGQTVTLQWHAVQDVVTAGLNGGLALQVTGRAYPREEHPDA